MLGRLSMNKLSGARAACIKNSEVLGSKVEAQPAQHRELIRRFVRAVIWVSLAAIILYCMALIAVDPSRALERLATLSFLQWMVLVGISFSSFCLRFLRWHYFLRRLRYNVPAWRSGSYYLAGLALRTTPAKIGETVRLWYLRDRHDVRFSASVAAFFVEHSLDLIVVAGLGAAVFASFGRNLTIIAYAAPVAILLLLVSLRFGFVREQLRRYVPGWAKRLGLDVRALDSSLDLVLTRRVIVIGFLLGLSAWTIQGAGLYYLLTCFDVEIPPWIAVGIFCASMLVGAVSFIPGGVGSAEAALTTLMVLQGIDTPTAIVIAILCRITTLWFAVALGVVAMLAIESGIVTQRRGHAPS